MYRLEYYVLLFASFWSRVQLHDDLLVGVFGTSQHERGSYTQLSKPKIIPSIVEENDPGSSNWVIEESDYAKMTVYDEALQLVRRVFEDEFDFASLKTNIRKFPFKTREDLQKILKIMYESRAKHKVFIYDHSPENLAGLCGFAEGFSLLQNIPTITWGCSQPSSSAADAFNSTLLSLQPSADLIAKSVVSVLHHFKWRRLAWLRDSGLDYSSSVCNQLDKHNMLSNDYFVIQVFESLDTSTVRYNDSKIIHEKIEGFWKKAYQRDVSAVVLCSPHQSDSKTFLHNLLQIAYSIDAHRFRKIALVLVNEIGLYEGSSFPYDDVNLRYNGNVRHSSKRQKVREGLETEDNVKEGIQLPEKRFRRSSSENAISPSNNLTDLTQELYENLLILSPFLDQQFPSLFKTFIDKQKGGNAVAYFAYLLDALFLAFAGTAQLIHQNQTKCFKDARLFISFLTQQSFQGFSGSLSFDPVHSSRRFNFTLWDVIQSGGKHVLSQVSMVDSTKMGKYFEVTEIKDIVWSLEGRPHADSCDHESIQDCLYPRKWSKLEYFAVVFVVGILFFAAVGIVYCRKRREWQALFRGPNKLFLTAADITFGKQHSSSRHNGNSLDVAKSKSDGRNNSWIALSVENNGEIATLKGEQVYLKKLCAGTVDMGSSSKKILQQLQALHHHNLNQFYGLLSTKAFLFLVMEYGCRGTLYDLLLARNITLNETIKMSLLQDLVRGMKYIHHSPIHCHGRLKSRNCVIDTRFAIKITDYGVNKFSSINHADLCVSETSEDLLWTAPELLRDVNLRRKGSQKGDSYSFAIICQEILLGQAPYAMHNLSPDQIIERLKHPTPTLRPIINSNELGDGLVQIMKQCWQEQPEVRMTFSAVNCELKNMSHHEKCNMVEYMMQQLENNREQLQKLVGERTMQLEEEKKKTEQLLMKMLPPSIALLLMTNQKISPELFEKSTIYFSDICGFTTISHSSTPMQVVEFLNALYTCFDEIIGRYEVYKVETIGDAYMVSSGIPKVIGDRHAEEAAMMSLDIMSATTTFRIDHLPHLKLRIRIGMHSGSAVAGVVGLTAPRYCLFGDTINTASRLETTGIPSRIHISCDTMECLKKSQKSFHLQERGTIELKGRGDMTTYWLLGMEGFNKPLPDPGSLTEPSHGISKDKLGKKDPVKNTSANNSKPFPSEKKNSLTTSSQKCFDKVVTTPPVRRGSSFLSPTPLLFIPPTTTSSTLTSVTETPKNSKKTKKKVFFKSSSVAPEESVNSIT